MITRQFLDGYVGQHIRTICQVGFHGDNHNHCAHFVSHVLGFQFGVTCRGMTPGQGTPGSIRVHEIFSRCFDAGTWAELPFPLATGLVFITNAANVNVQNRTMVNVPRKHVGIFFGGSRDIWHYSNAQRRVVRQAPSQFVNHYSAPDNAMFWGVL